MLSLLIALAAQGAPNRLPPAQALPAPGAEEQLVLQPINELFAGMAAKDGARILAQVRPDGRLTSANGTEIKTTGWADFAARFKPGEGPALEERLVGTPAIEIDGNIALVWSPYIFLMDGKISHCGIDHFDLVRDQARWKVLNITWSKRTTNCEAQ
jgi:hypothetical protein